MKAGNSGKVSKNEIEYPPPPPRASDSCSLPTKLANTFRSLLFLFRAKRWNQENHLTIGTNCPDSGNLRKEAVAPTAGRQKMCWGRWAVYRNGSSRRRAFCAWGFNPSGATRHTVFLALVFHQSSELEGEPVALWVGGNCPHPLLKHLVIREPDLVDPSTRGPQCAPDKLGL